ncbi:hypothetical protein [Breoghania sp.]|uniref:hypothetical protein n=1 Tax=Breoghania sp. TaxID=2065378 RepID=UPI0029CA64EC|nr:hypothetical protein [Breoghania sp.]
MTRRSPRKSDGQNKRTHPAVLVLAGLLAVCLLYLVSLSLWALTQNFTATAGRPAIILSSPA